MKTYREHQTKPDFDKPVLELEQVHVDLLPVRNKQTSQRLLSNISFSLQAGKIVGLVGQSGSGKTLTCLSILHKLSSDMRLEGQIRLRGNDLSTCSERELRKVRGAEIGYIAQNPMNALVPVRTIGQQFQETLLAHRRYTRKEVRERSITALEQMGLPEPEKCLRQYPFELSGGMLQRVLIGLTMCLSPSVIIADEPTTALDSVNQYRILEHLEQLRRNHQIAILLITHDLDIVAELADEVMVMQNGQIVERGDVFSVFEQPLHSYTRLLLNNRLNLDRVKEDLR